MLSLSLLALVPTAIVGILMLDQLADNVSERFDSELAREASLVQQELERSFVAQGRSLIQFSGRTDLARGLSSLLYNDELRRSLEQFQQNTPGVNAIYALDEYGFVVESSGGNIRTVEMSELVERKINQAPAPWVGFWSEPGITEGHDHSQVAWLPVRFKGTRKKSELVGYLLVITSMDHLIDSARLHLSPGEKIKIATGNTVLATDLVAQADQESTNRSSRAGRSNNEYRSFYRSVELTSPLVPEQSLSLRIELLQPSKWREEWVDGAVSNLYTVLAVALMLCLILAALMSLWLTDIFNRLLGVVAQYRLGNYQDPPNYHPRTVEVQQVVILLKQMANQIQRQFSDLHEKNSDLAALSGELQQTNHSLEQKVADRTHQLHLLARTDALTGLGNRQAFEEALHEAENSRRHYALFVIDINGLKPVNDNHGHKYGDELINNVARMLQANCREQDGLYRIGGDEFVVLLPGADQQACQALADRLIDTSADSVLNINKPNGELIRAAVGFSLGYALSQETGHRKVFEFADQRMYQAKRQHYTDMRADRRKAHSQADLPNDKRYAYR